ncbi:MAG: hypothetical protein ACE5F6_10200 [Anaerolineae bacterium]
MPESRDSFDDGLGPDPLDRGSGKQMGAGGGGGSDIDPSYEDALRIMGRAHEIPSPFEQRALIMDNPDAAELARRLTALRRAAGADLGRLLVPADTPPAGQAVEDFITALQEVPPKPVKLTDLRQQIQQAEADVQTALAKVCEPPVVQARLAGEGPPGLDFPGLELDL